MARIGIGALLLLLVVYGGWKATPLLLGPSLSLISPTQHQSAPDGFVTLSGHAHHTETLTANGGLLLIDRAGYFEDTLLLPSGGAILTLTATDRFGRSVTKTRSVYIP